MLDVPALAGHGASTAAPAVIARIAGWMPYPAEAAARYGETGYGAAYLLPISVDVSASSRPPSGIRRHHPRRQAHPPRARRRPPGPQRQNG